MIIFHSLVGWFGSLGKGAAIAGLACALLFSCSPKAIGYQNHPLKPAYYPNRYHLHIGQITLVDIQKP